MVGVGEAFGDEVDAVVTKPGGVTVSELLHKRIPMFTIDCLPGQERINLQYLQRNGLIYHLAEPDRGERAMLRLLNDDVEKNRFFRRVSDYFAGVEKTGQEALAEMVAAMPRRRAQRVLHP